MRCAYCHDDLELEHHRCEGCGTLLHLDCSTSNPVCPTLGCAVPGREPPPIPIKIREVFGHPTTKRLVAWILLGVLFPLLAFGLDASVRADPLIWGSGFLEKIGGHGAPAPQRLPYLHLALVWGATGLSMLGLILFALRRTRASLPLLSLGVVVSGAHALAFVPLLPYSLIGILFAGIGLLGLLPFATFWVFLDAVKRARTALQDDERWGESLLVRQSARIKRRALLFVGALTVAGVCFLSPRPETFHSPGEWDMASVDFKTARLDALVLLQTQDPTAKDEAERKLLAGFETYGRGTTPYAPSRVESSPGRVRVGWGEPEPAKGELAAPVQFGHWVWIMADPDEDPPTAPGTRSVEFAPGIWSQWQHTRRAANREPELQHLPLW